MTPNAKAKPRELRGLPKTLQFLAQTKNEAAMAVLLPSLDAAQPEVQEGALRAILDRRSPQGQREVLKRLHLANPRWREIIDERRGRLAYALRDGVLGAELQLCTNACQAILWFREYDLMPALITAAEDETNTNADLVAQSVLDLADQLYDDLSAPRNYNDRRDPQLIRRAVTGSLEASVSRFARHQRSEVMDAFLELANRDNSTLKLILQDPHHPSYLSLVDTLSHSARGGVMRLLLSYLDDPHAPSAAISVLARRGDRKFIQHLLRKIGFEPSPVAAQNLKRVENISWLRAEPTLLDELDDAAQHSLLQLVMASNMKRLDVYKTIERLLTHGKPGGRRAAAQALAKFNGAEANALALQALGDSDARVQAQVALQLRQRGIPGALTRLIEMIDSPHEVVRQAARDSLAEFNFDRYLAAFDMLDDEVRRTTGVLVKKINQQAVPTLAEEMKERSRTRRLRALAVASAMEAVPDLESCVIELLTDEDHLVRAEAARALVQSNTSATRAALREALEDRSVVVQETAHRTLQVLVRESGENDPIVAAGRQEQSS